MNNPPTAAALDAFDDRWILHDDGDLLVVNKPGNLALLADRSGVPCLWDLARARFGPGLKLVHRLDKGTSGVLLLARSAPLQKKLTRAFNQRLPRKTYLAVVRGRLPLAGSGLIDLPLRKGRKSRYRIAGQRDSIRCHQSRWSCTEDGGAAFPAQTRVRTLDPGWVRAGVASDTPCSLLMLQPKTGRTHQLRVHLAWIGYPIAGDSLYGRHPNDQTEPLALHARSLVCPGLGKFTAPLPTRWGSTEN